MKTTALQTAPLDFYEESWTKAEKLVHGALAEAYPDGAPDGAIELLKTQEKPGTICAMFFSGRSGSYFAQSFFDNETHPQVISACPSALQQFETSIREQDIAQFNSGVFQRNLSQWAIEIVRVLPGFYSQQSNRPEFDSLLAPKDLFSKFVYAQLLLLKPGNLTYDAMLKILLLAYRLSRGGKLNCRSNLVYLWQAHVPSPDRKKWIVKTFPKVRLLTVVRFPEKSFDSHLVHHGFENIFRPRHILMRNLFFWQMTLNHELADGDDTNQKAIRFEDLHHHTAEVLEKLCAWWDVKFDPALVKKAGAMMVRGTNVSGARKLTRAEFDCKLLNYYDRLKLRFLLQEEYRAWGYDRYCEPSLEASLTEFQNDELARQTLFSPVFTLGALDQTAGQILIQEAQTLQQIIPLERDRRDKGIRLVPLLYDLNDFPQEGLPKT